MRGKKKRRNYLSRGTKQEKQALKAVYRIQNICDSQFRAKERRIEYKPHRESI
jgi:hypothetical protein